MGGVLMIYGGKEKWGLSFFVLLTYTYVSFWTPLDYFGFPTNKYEVVLDAYCNAGENKYVILET